MLRKNFILLSVVISGSTCGATITLPRYITDNMIVQQNSLFKICGKGTPETEITIMPGWDNSKNRVKIDKSGSFEVNLKTPSAGGPYLIRFEEKNGESLIIENVLSGEVWLCSGQSNMEFPVQGWTTVMDYDREIATAYHPDIRLLQVRKTTSLSPRDNVIVNGDGWQICNSSSMADFSAIAYFFAKELSDKLRIPVGVIDATWGGTPAEAWTSYQALGGIEGFENDLSAIEKSGFDIDRLVPIYLERMERWKTIAYSSHLEFDKSESQEDDSWGSIPIPGYWENTVLPEFDGIVWLQKDIDLTADIAGKDMVINFTAIDDEDEVYFNGEKIGSGSGYNVARSYDVPGKLVKPGKNVLTVKIVDTGGEGGIAPGVAELRQGDDLINIAGEWRYLVETDFSKLPAKPADPESSSYPTVLYNAMVYPFRNFPIKGILWYQGCANVGRDEQYAPLFKSLIQDWRSLWKSDLPFYFVQLAGFRKHKAVQPDSNWALLRDAQAKALELDNTAMATAIDLGNPDDIHPKNKQDVAHRLALIALGRDYGFPYIYAGPECESVISKGESLVLKFGSPVHSSSNAMTGFIIAGDDGKYATATPVVIDDCTISLSAPGVARPVSVKYNWADFPCGNLYGETNLPVAPFSKNL